MVEALDVDKHRLARYFDLANGAHSGEMNGIEAYPHGSQVFVKPNNFRRACVRHVVDGDTVYLDIECLDNIVTVKERCRLAHINAPEINTEEGPRAKAHLDMLSEQHGCQMGCVVECLGRDNYGRRLVSIWSDDGSVNLNQKMIDDGFAKVLEEGKT